MPGDWVAIFYYALGLGQVIQWGWLVLGGSRNGFYALWAELPGQPEEDTSAQTRFDFVRAVGIALVFLAVPVSMLILDQAVPEKFEPLEKETVLQMLAEENMVYADPAAESELREFISQGSSRVDPGRAVYPEVVQGSEGSELSVYLLGVEDRWVRLPIDEEMVDFPHGADVIVISCKQDAALYAAGVIFMEEDEKRVLSAPDIAGICQ